MFKEATRWVWLAQREEAGLSKAEAQIVLGLEALVKTASCSREIGGC